MEAWQKTISGALLTTVIWVIATYYTPPSSDETLRKFYRLIKPGGPGWDPVIEKANAAGDFIQKETGQLPLELLCVVIACLTVYGILFATGNWIYGRFAPAMLLSVISALGTYFLFWAWGKLKMK